MGSGLVTANKQQELLLDTHIWIWLLEGSKRLPPDFLPAISEATACWLSPISVWEFGILVRKRKIEIDTDIRSWVDRAMHVFPVREAGMNREIALLANEIDLPHPDPADRILAATALTLGLKLVTVDRRLVSDRGVPTLDIDGAG